MCRRARPDSHAPMADRISVFTLRIALNETLISIRQTDVDTLMIRTQSRVRVRVRVIYLNQTGNRHQILGGVGVRMMHS